MFIDQSAVWIKICIVLAILRRWIKIEKFCTEKGCMWICISGWQIDNLGKLCTQIITWCGGWLAGQRCCRSVYGWLRSTSSFASPAGLQIRCGAILGTKASRCVVLMKHSWVTFNRSLHLFMLRKLNTSLLLFSHVSMRFINQILCFIHCHARKPYFGHFGHIQGQVHVGLGQLYPTTLPCHSSRHVEILQEISCCFQQRDLAITSTIYSSTASSKVIKSCVFHSWGCLSGNSSVKMSALTTLWSIYQTVQINSFVVYRGFPLWAAINWSHSSIWTPAVRYTVCWPLCSSIRLYPHPTACCFWFLLPPVWQTIFKCASRFIY